MVRVTTQITIAPDIDDVFSYFADLRNELAWNHGHVRHVVMTTPRRIGRGTAFVGDHPGFGTAPGELPTSFAHLVLQSRAKSVREPIDMSGSSRPSKAQPASWAPSNGDLADFSDPLALY